MRNKEGQIPSEALYLAGALVLLGAISLFGFSPETRKRIRDRDQVDVIDGSVERLEAAHIDHSKDNPRYDDASNGRLLTTRNHYLIDHVHRRGRNGLTLEQNKWAMEKIWERLTDEEKATLPPPA